jgi:hypothetical protein
MNGFRLQRLGQMLEPEPGNPLEAEGVLNPAAVRGPDGKLYIASAMQQMSTLQLHKLPRGSSGKGVEDRVAASL